MDNTDFLDLVRLEAPERLRLLAMLDDESASKRHGRKSSRHPCRGEMVPLVVLQPGRIISPFLVLMRNVSAGGLSVIHGGYLHTGTTCRVLLESLEGTKVVLSGAVKRCRHIKGNLHEVGLAFESAIVPEDFVPPELLAAHVEDLATPEKSAERPDVAASAEGAGGVGAAVSAEVHEPASEHSRAA